MAVNQRSFWDALRPATEISLRGAVQGNVKYRNYLKSALLGAEVERPSGTYIGHYDTGALYKSIRDYYTVTSLSAKRYKIGVGAGMLDYGYKLSDGYRAEPVGYEKLYAWSGRGTPLEPARRLQTARPWIGAIYQTLRKRPFRKGSNWIGDANEDFFPAFEKKVSLESTKGIDIGLGAYVDNAIRSIFGKIGKSFSEGAQI